MKKQIRNSNTSFWVKLPVTLLILFAALAFLPAAEPSFAAASEAPGGVVRANGEVQTTGIVSFETALGSKNIDIDDTVSGVLKVTLKTDITLSNPLRITRGTPGDKVILDLNGHSLTGADGQNGTDREAAAGKNALEITAVDFDVVIKGPGNVTGGKGAIYEHPDVHFKYGLDGGMGICLMGISSEEYYDTLNYGLTVTDGAVITGGAGADVSADEWQFNLNNCTDGGGADAGSGGVGIGQPIKGLNTDSAYPAYYKLIIENGLIAGGAGGNIDMGGVVPTYYSLMNTDAAERRMEGLAISSFGQTVGNLAGATIGAGGDGIDIGSGRKYLHVDSAGSVIGGSSGSADYGSYKTINRFPNWAMDAGSGIAVYGDIGLTNDEVDFSSWQSKEPASSDMGIYIAGTVKGGDSPNAYALNEGTGHAGHGLLLHGEISYGNSSNWGIIDIAEGGSIAGGDAGTAVSGNAGRGGAGIYEAYRKNDDTTTGASPYGTDYYIVDGSVLGGRGGTAYSNADGHYNTPYSTMVYTSALSAEGGFGSGGNGFFFGQNRENVNIVGSGTVLSGDAGNTVDRGDADVSGSVSEPIYVYPEAKLDTFHVTAATQEGSGSAALSRNEVPVRASMSPFSSDPSTATKLSCTITKPAGYTGDVYIKWVAALYPSGGALPRDIESSGTNYTDFHLLSNNDYRYLAYPTYEEHPELNMNHYNYDLTTAESMGEDDIRNKKIEVYCYVLLEDGSWGKSNIIEFKSGQGWSGGSSDPDPQPTDDQAAADAVAALIDQLPGLMEVTLDDEDAVAAARAAYDNLTDAQKSLIPELTLMKLENLENEIAEKRYTADRDAAAAAAGTIADQLQALPEDFSQLDPEDPTDAAAIAAAKTALETAITAYNDLTDNQKQVFAELDAEGLLDELQAVTAEFAEAFPEEALPGLILPITEDMVQVDNATFTGKPLTPAVTVTAEGTDLVQGRDYDVTYANNLNAGQATAIVTGKGSYCGTVKAPFTIAKAGNPLYVKGKTTKVKAKKVKKKTQTLSRAKVLTVTKAQGTVTYAKAKGHKKISINKKTGKVTVKKKLKKGTYKVTVRVTAAGNGNYKALTKKVTFKVKVK